MYLHLHEDLFEVKVQVVFAQDLAVHEERQGYHERHLKFGQRRYVT